jgi:hypothetical protein
MIPLKERFYHGLQYVDMNTSYTIYIKFVFEKLSLLVGLGLKTFKNEKY